MEIYHLEEEVLPELAQVLGIDERALSEKLAAAHVHARKPRPEEKEPAAPADPWGVKGHAYVGTFTMKGPGLVAGDPIYVTSKHDETPQDVTKNVRIPAASGTWLCYAELDPQDPTDVTIGFVAVHESMKAEMPAARTKATAVGKLWVDSGRMAFVDAAIRDDAAYEDARLFGGDDHGVIGGRGCLASSGGGDGTYTTRVVLKEGKAVYVHVDFTGESRDFLKDAKEKLSR